MTTRRVLVLLLVVMAVTVAVARSRKPRQTPPDVTTYPVTGVVTAANQQAGQTFQGTADEDLVLGTAGSDSFTTGTGDDVIMDDNGQAMPWKMMVPAKVRRR